MIVHLVLRVGEKAKAEGITRGLFDEPNGGVYSTFNFCYKAEDFKDLAFIMECNVIEKLDVIKAAIKRSMERRKLRLQDTKN